jgi:predicted MarR family transcription regulator
MAPTVFQLNTLRTLEEPETKRVFSVVVGRRAVRVSDLVGSTGPRESVQQSLKKLEDANLVKVKPSVIRDFDTYVITAEGLEAARLIAA